MGRIGIMVFLLLVACKTTEQTGDVSARRSNARIDRDQIWVQDAVTATTPYSWDMESHLLDETIRLLREQTLRQEQLSKQQKSWTVDPSYVFTLFITRLSVSTYAGVGLETSYYYRASVGGVAVLTPRSGGDEPLAIPFWHHVLEAHDGGVLDPKLVTQENVIDSFATEIARDILKRLPLADRER